MKDKGLVILVLVIALLMPLIAYSKGFCSVNSLDIEGNKELARLLATMSFPMTGVMTFILGQALVLRKDSDSKAFKYTSIASISGVTIIVCAVTGLISTQYFKSSGDMWLSSALLLLLLIFALLIANAFLFLLCTFTRV